MIAPRARGRNGINTVSTSVVKIIIMEVPLLITPKTPPMPPAKLNAHEKSSPFSSILSFTRSSSVVFHLSNLLI